MFSLLTCLSLFLLSGCEALNPFVSSSLDRDGDGEILGEDCDDMDPMIGILTWYLDNDHDDYGTTGGITQCETLDGYADRSGDCDDTNPGIYPGATEVCDSVDNNCDMVIDVDAIDRETWYADGDEDGYGDINTPLTACVQPAGSVTDTADCDDTDPLVHPDATEVCADQIDNDCNGIMDTDAAYVTWYRDADRDGYGDITSTASDCQQPSGYVSDTTDCDDTNSSINPGAEEICNDAIDNNCDFEAAECLWIENQPLSERIKILGFENGDQTGYATTFFDANRDGLDDLVIGSPGHDEDNDNVGLLSIFLSPIEEEKNVTQADFSFFGMTTEENVGYTLLSSPDITGDSLPDLLIGAPTADVGYVYLLSEMTDGETLLADSSTLIIGETNGDRAGASLTSAGDLNEDGYTDFLVGAYLATGDASASGSVYLVTGPVRESIISLIDVYKLSGEKSSDRTGWSIASGEDVSGDGVPDVVIGAFLASDESRSQTGKAYLIYGPVTSNLSLADADGVLTGEEVDARLGSSVVIIPDYNEDGITDVLLGAYYESSAFTQAGAVYVVTFWTEETMPITDYEIKLTGSSVEELAGWSVGWQEDMGADGQEDLLIGAYKADTSAATQSGSLYLLKENPGEGVFDLASVCLSFFGETIDDQAGYAFASHGNLNEDSYIDLLVGSPGYGDTGSVYLVPGTGL